MWNRRTPFRKCSKVLNIIYFLTGVVENSKKQYNKKMTKSPFCPFTNLKETDECLWFPEKHNQANFSPQIIKYMYYA